MNVFDFDKTLYDGDSTLDFYLFCLRRHPGLIRALSKQLKGAVRFTLGGISRDEFKEEFYRFLSYLETPEDDVRAFWQTNLSKMKSAVACLASPGDLVISASPEFLLDLPCKEYGWTLIASRVDMRTGRVRGANCRGQEKVRRLEEAYPTQPIDSFYSDSLSDAPLAILARRSYLVKGNKIIDWPNLPAQNMPN